MTGELGAGTLHVTSNGAANPALADRPVADDARDVAPELVVERVNAYGFHAEPVTTTGVWWVPFAHSGSLSPRATGVRVEWAL